MAASEVSIINRALILLKAGTITDRAGTSVQATLSNAVFDDVRDELLRSHPWSFATRRVQLARSARVPVSEFDYQYPVPSGYLRTVVVSDSDLGKTNVDYRIADDETDGTVILTDATTLYLTYVAQITDVSKFPPDFREALSMALARDLAPGLTGSSGAYGRMAERAEKALMKAKSVESIEDMPDQRPEGSWASSRHGNRWY